jgi:Protein of unknown function (DUF2785)
MDHAFWQNIVASDFALPEGYTVTDLTPELLTFLGSTDIAVRDPFGYTIFAHWIVRDGHYDAAALRDLRDKLLANLKVGLGEQDTDSVFLRSFSVLILSLLIYRDNQQSFFTQEEIKDLLDQLLVYFAAEQDLRGYTPDKGWAHSSAHTADCFKFLARSIKSTTDDHQRILAAVADKLLWPVVYVYIHGEDERLVSALIDILKRQQLDLKSWTNWLDRFAAWKQSGEEGDFKPEIHAPWLNSKNVLRSFYFRLEQNPELPPPAVPLKPKLLDLIKLYGQ